MFNRFCYYNELCPEGGPHKSPTGGQQATTDMWAPIQTSADDTTPDWVQIGTRADGMCNKHSVAHGIESINAPGSWMATDVDKLWKRIYPCCPKGK